MRWLRAADIDVVPHDLMLAWSAVYGGTLKITLEHVVKELLGVELDKTMQKSDWSGELTKDQIQYAFDDAYFTLMAWRKLTGIMAPEQVAGYELFKNSQRPVMRMMEAGVGFDIDGHAELLSRFERKFIWAEDWLARHVPDVKNWSSSSQVAKWLNDSLPENVKGRWPRTEKTLAMKTGADACKQFILDVDRDLRRVFWAYQILQTYRKYISTYGEKLVRNHYRDRRLYGNFRIGRAITGRMASEKPNLQNMPGRGPIGAAFRSLFIAPPGSRLVIADYSQIEVRVGGILADEPAFKEMFERGYDVHAATAALMLGKEYDEVFDSEKKSVRPEYKHARSAAKEITFGMQYGMGDRTLASKLNLTVREARQEIRKWEENFPKVTEWREKSAEYGARDKGLVMPSGRTITLDYRPSPQACYNYPVQGTAGDVMYAALAELDRRLDEADIDAVPLLVVHDEVVLEAAEADAEEAARILEEAMVAGFRKLFPDGGINNLVEASVCSTWADKS
jgi:DNA polymerase I